MSRNVYFLSQLEAERLIPIPGAAMISITDPDKLPAPIYGWDSIYRDAFYDGGYSETTIMTMKSSFEQNYASYIDSNQAARLVDHIEHLVSCGVNEIYVHCYFGESRSAAVALFLCNKYGFKPNKPIIKPNKTVYDILCNPYKYEQLIRIYTKTELKSKSSIFDTVIDLFLVAIGYKR
jgi:hypothetical protein